MRELTTTELEECKPGELTLATILAVAAIGFAMVIIYRLFKSTKGSSTLPGGYKFTWN